MIDTKEKWDKLVKNVYRNKGRQFSRKKYEKRTIKYGYSLARKNSVYLKELRRKMTKSEEKFGYILCETGIKFMFQKGFFKPFHRIADFYLPHPYGIIIEIDGCYHKTVEQKDNIKDIRWSAERNIKTLRIKNEEVDILTPQILSSMIYGLK